MQGFVHRKPNVVETFQSKGILRERPCRVVDVAPAMGCFFVSIPERRFHTGRGGQFVGVTGACTSIANKGIRSLPCSTPSPSPPLSPSLYSPPWFPHAFEYVTTSFQTANGTINDLSKQYKTERIDLPKTNRFFPCRDRLHHRLTVTHTAPLQ
jgi:hypothetical protein